MKIVIAIDSLKGSLSSIDAGNSIKEGILKVIPNADIIVKPLADGGEGTTDALIEGMGGEKINLNVMGPIEKKVNAYYGHIKSLNTAIIEMASASGIELISENENNPMKATTYGVGEMIIDAISRGCINFIIGIGGSATNDGGVGMLKALGFEFLDENGNDIGYGAQALGKISSINDKNIHPLLNNCNFKIACDVNNPLCGKNGATYVFGPQKGVTDDMKALIDKDMKHYANISSKFTNRNFENAKGAGAAGGLGFAFITYLNAVLYPGIELILNSINLEEDICDANIVITGEGKLDNQTSMGKAPIGVAKLAKKYKIPVIAFAGAVTDDANLCNTAGIDAFFPIVRGVTTLEEAMDKENTRKNIILTVEQVFNLIKLYYKN